MAISSSLERLKGETDDKSLGVAVGSCFYGLAIVSKFEQTTDA